MALDAIVAGTTADSYLTVAEADVFAQSRLGPFAEQWLSTTTTDKEKALKQATADVDNHAPAGVRYLSTQALGFPRLSDVNGVAYIPHKVREATYEQAVFLLANADELDQAAARRARGFLSYSDDQGTGGTLALNASFGLFSPRAMELLTTLSDDRRRFAGTVIIRSRYPTGMDEL